LQNNLTGTGENVQLGTFGLKQDYQLQKVINHAGFYQIRQFLSNHAVGLSKSSCFLINQAVVCQIKLLLTSELCLNSVHFVLF
jgi:hypothetical protein